MSEIEYFYSAHSAFAYLGPKRFMEIAKAAGRTIVHKPYDLTRGIAGSGRCRRVSGRRTTAPIISAARSTDGPNTGTPR